MRPLISLLFPYTTLFRSVWLRDRANNFNVRLRQQMFERGNRERGRAAENDSHHQPTAARPRSRFPRSNIRSDEHTSELQSHSDLVCRLLLEKKKSTYYST